MEIHPIYVSSLETVDPRDHDEGFSREMLMKSRQSRFDLAELPGDRINGQVTLSVAAAGGPWRRGVPGGSGGSKLAGERWDAETGGIGRSCLHTQSRNRLSRWPGEELVARRWAGSDD